MGANAESTRSWVESWNRGDIEVLTAHVGLDFEWVVARDHPDATTHRGPDAVGSYLREWIKMMELRVEIIELEESADRVLAILSLAGTGSGSGNANRGPHGDLDHLPRRPPGPDQGVPRSRGGPPCFRDDRTLATLMRDPCAISAP